MSRILLLALCLTSTACSAVRHEFTRVNPEEVGVVIGFEVTGSKTLDPRLTGAGYVAGLFIPGLTGFALSMGALTVNEVLRTDNAVTMVDELNDAVYADIEKQLTAKGYKVRLLKKQPIAFTVWRNAKQEPDYLTRIGSQFQLTESELQASGVDTLLYVEYRVDANIASVDELTSMAAIDLQVDRVSRNAVAFSMPPANRVLYSDKLYLAGYMFRRMNFEDVLECITWLEDWPERKT